MKPLNNKMPNGNFRELKKMLRPFRAFMGGWSTQGVALGYVCSPFRAGFPGHLCVALSGQDSSVIG